MEAYPPVPKIVAVIAVRHSRSFPERCFVLAGASMLTYTLERLAAVARLDQTVIATSADRSDDPVARFAEACGTPCWRGSLDDVLGRLRDAAAARGADAVVRISGDSPLIDPAIVAAAVELYLDGPVDLVTNVFPRSFPMGQSVEVLSRGALERLALEAAEAADREHVTRYAYASRSVRHSYFCGRATAADLQLSVDTPADFERAAALIKATADATDFASVDRLVELAQMLPAM